MEIQTDRARLVARLTQMGLEAGMAEVYVHLLTSGETKARDVALATGLPRPKTYRLLDGLARRGLARFTMTRPALHAAVTPDDAVRALLAEQEERAQQLRAVGDAFVQAATRVRREESPPRTAPGRLRLLVGRTEATFEAQRMLAAARGEVRLVDQSGPAARRPVPWFAPAIAAPDGVRVRVLTDLEASESGGRRPNLEVRAQPGTVALRFMVADDSEAILGLGDPATGEKGGPEGFLHATSAGLTAALTCLFESMWRGRGEAADEDEGGPQPQDRNGRGFESYAEASARPRAHADPERDA